MLARKVTEQPPGAAGPTCREAPGANEWFATFLRIGARLDKQAEIMEAQEAAADAYVRALTENPNGDPNGVCFEAAQELL